MTYMNKEHKSIKDTKPKNSISQENKTKSYPIQPNQNINCDINKKLTKSRIFSINKINHESSYNLTIIKNTRLSNIKIYHIPTM